MGKETIRSRFFEDELAAETVEMAQVILEVIDNDPPITNDVKSKNLMKFVTDILDRYIQHSGWGEWSEAVDEQTKATVEYLPWALLGRMTSEASHNLNFRRENARSVRIYLEVAQRLDLENDPRQLEGLIDQKTGVTLDLIEASNEVDIERMVQDIRMINEAIFPSGF